MTLGNIIWLGVIVFFAYRMIKNGGCCGGHDHSGHGENSKDNQGHSGHNNSEIGHQHHMQVENSTAVSDKDPVCGMSVKDDSPVSEHLGRTFHFCSEQCRKIFSLNPGKYISHT